MSTIYNNIESDDLTRVRDVRNSMVDAMMKGGCPEDKDGIDTLSKVLKDMETSVFTKARIRSQNGKEDTDSQLNDAMVRLLDQMKPKDYQQAGCINTNLPKELPSELDEIPVEGELGQGTEDGLISDFADIID